jgi:hypothetical protein
MNEYKSVNLAKIKLLKKSMELGRTPLSTELGSDRFYVTSKLGDRSFEQAVKNVGLTPLSDEEKTKLHMYRTEIKYKIQIVELSNKLGRSPTKTEFMKEYNKVITPRIIDNYNNILLELGLDLVKEQNNYSHLSDKDFIDLYIELCNKLGKTATVEDINGEENYPSATTFIYRFESINKLREIAGYKQKNMYSIYSKESIIKILKEIYIKYGENAINTTNLKKYLKEEEYTLTYGTIKRYLGKTVSEIWKNVLEKDNITSN